MQSIDVMAGMPMVVENITPTNPHDPLGMTILDLRRSDSGVDVSHTSALGHPPLLHGVTIIGGDMGQLPVCLKRHHTRDGKHHQDVIPDHEAARVARDRAIGDYRNIPIAVSDFREMMMNHALLTGNGCAYIERDTNTARPRQLIPLGPYPHTQLEYDDTGRLWYKSDCWTYDSNKLETRYFDPIDVLHIKGLSHDGLWGYSLLDIARDQIGYGIAVRRHGSSSFANDQVPRGIIKHPGKMDDDKAGTLRRRFFNKHGGSSNSGNIALLQNVMEFQAISFSNEDAQLIEALEKDRELQAELLNIPKFMLGIGERPGFTTEQLYQFYLASCLGRWMNKWCEQYRMKLLNQREIDRGEFQFEFDTSKFRLVDWEKRVASVNSLVGGPAMDRDEGRSLLGMNPARPDQEFLERSTGAPSQSDDDDDDSSGVDDDTQELRTNDIVRRLLANTLQGICKTETQLLSTAAAKERDFGVWSAAFYGEQWVRRLSDVVSEDTAQRYCAERRAELTDLLEGQPASAIETDCRGHRERGTRLLNYELGVA